MVLTSLLSTVVMLFRRAAALTAWRRFKLKWDRVFFIFNLSNHSRFRLHEPVSVCFKKVSGESDGTQQLMEFDRRIELADQQRQRRSGAAISSGENEQYGHHSPQRENERA